MQQRSQLWGSGSRFCSLNHLLVLLFESLNTQLCFCLQVSFPVGDQAAGGGGGNGNLPPGGPLPPHLVVKEEKGWACNLDSGLQTRFKVQTRVSLSVDGGTGGPVPGVTGQGYSGGGAQWERGANLKEYYAKKEEQEAQAVPDPVLLDLLTPESFRRCETVLLFFRPWSRRRWT